MSKKKYNPKSHAPAVYIASWLIQVPHSELSFGAKILYGRLSQWSNAKGDVYRSAPQLSKEVGMKDRTIKKFIKELKDCGLIGTKQPQAGGVNHFEFYDHEWMSRELVKELSYEHEEENQSSNTQCTTVPGGSAQPCTGVVHDRARISKKEIETNNIKEKNIKKESSESRSIAKQSKSKPKTTAMSLDDLLKDNHHMIPKELIQDWMTVRRAKRAPITPTVWKGINKQLKLCSYSNKCAVECFETMVERGWTTFRMDWIENIEDSSKKNTKSSKKGKDIDNDDSSWIEGINW